MSIYYQKLKLDKIFNPPIIKTSDWAFETIKPKEEITAYDKLMLELKEVDNKQD